MQSITPAFTFQYEKRMRALKEDEFARALMAESNFWARVSKKLDIDGASERFTWFLNTADIKPDGQGGTQDFDPLVTQTTELVPQRYKAGISIKKDQLLDLRGGGLDALAEWSTQIGYKTAYFPQRLLTELLMNGANTDGSATAYDTVPFFADNNTVTTFGGVSVTGHPYNPYQPGLGGYINWLHGSASGTYPGALPLWKSDGSITVDQAVINLQAAIAYVKGWKMPDGITPRFLRPAAIICAPAPSAQVAQVLSAKYIAQGAKSGGGSGDIMAIIRRWGLPEPIVADELAGTTNYSTKILQAKTDGSGTQVAYTETITGSDTTWYLVMEQNLSTQLGGIIHVVREPFRVNFFTGEGGSSPATGIDAILNRALEIEYHCTGRLSMQFGHPYAIVRVDAT